MGGYGTVYMFGDKILKICLIKDSDYHIQSIFNHPNILSVEGIYESGPYHFMVQQKKSGDLHSLRSKINKINNNKVFPIHLLQIIAKNLVKGCIAL